MRKCTKCSVDKDESKFYLKRGKPSAQCKDCRNEYHKNWYANNQSAHLARVKSYKDRNRSKIRAAKYGITEQELLTGLAQPCMICSESAEVVDHDHAMGIFRGFLCAKCNLGLGLFRDDSELLAKAISYLG
jgi:hypothetical protein